jgi:uncharacterized membrane protein YbaN (DUF454 family)
MFVGFISLALGILGIFLPLLPTTPFLLLSAALFARSSPRFYHLLLNHKVLGSYIRNFLIEKTIPLRIKILSISLLWLTILGSLFFVVEKTWLQVLLAVIALAVTIHILSFKTARSPSPLVKGAHAKKFLFGGLGLLALAGIAHLIGAPPFYVRLLFCLAILCKVIFLVTILFIKRKVGLSLPLKFILAGVVFVFLSHFFIKQLLYVAIALKVIGLLLLLFSKKK